MKILSAKKMGLLIGIMTFIFITISFLSLLFPLVILTIANNLVIIGVFTLLFLLIGKNLYLIHKKRFPFLRIFHVHQRALGLLVFSFFVMHIVSHLLAVIVQSLYLYVILINVLVITVFMFFMYLTSFPVFQKKIKKWKKYHRFVWGIFPLILAHAYIATRGNINIFLFFPLPILALWLCYERIYVPSKKVQTQIRYFLVGCVMGSIQIFVNFMI